MPSDDLDWQPAGIHGELSVALLRQLRQSLPPSGLYERILAEVEPALLRAALAATSGNQLRAAELLGINRNTLRVKLRERNVKVIRGLPRLSQICHI